MESRTMDSWVRRSVANRVGFRTAVVCLMSFVLTMAIGLPVSAQSNDASNSETLEEVVVEAEREEGKSLLGPVPKADPGEMTAEGGQLGPLGNRDYMDVPFSGVSYTDTFVESQVPVGIRDILKNDPSVTNESARGAHFDGFRIRGDRANYIYGGLPGPFDRGASHSLEQYSRVEVLKGPSGVMNVGATGTGFVGGIVNLVPKRATDRPITKINLNYLSGDAHKMHADIGRRLGADNQFGVRLNMVSEHGELNIDGTTIDRESVHLAMDYRANKTDVTLDLGYQDSLDKGAHPKFDGFGPVSSIPEAPKLDRTYGQPWQEDHDERFSAVARVEHQLTTNWTGGVSYSDVHLNEDGPTEATADFVDDNGSYRQTLRLNQHANRYYQNFTTYVKGNVETPGLFGTGEIDHNVALTYYTDKDDNDVDFGRTITADTSSLSDPVYMDEVADSQAGPTPDFSESETKYTSLIDEMRFQNGKYRLLAGVQSIELRRPSDDGYEESEVVPVTAFTYKPSDGQTYYASYSEAFERGDAAPFTASNFGERTNPLESTQIEVGYKRDLGNYRYSTALFQVTKDRTHTNPTTDVFGIFGEQEHTGVEASISGRIQEGFRVTGGALYMDAELTETPGGSNNGNIPVAIPEFRARLTSEYDVDVGAKHPLTLSGGIFHTGEQQVNAANTLEIPSWTTLDLGVHKTFEDPATGADLTANLKVENVTDERYWDNAAFGLSPGNPRTIRFSLSSRF